MASPHASSFICLPFGNETQVVEAYTVYFSVCLSSAVVGVIGATLFLFQVVRGEPYVGLSRSQRCILVFLAVSDLFADVGVIARSTYWLGYWRPYHFNQDSDFSQHLAPAIGGAIVESWVFFWYLATFFWTFFFAVDVYNSKHGGIWRLWCSQIFTWLFCFIFVAGSVASLWACKPYTQCAADKLCVVSHFLCTYGPIAIFMAALPVFYCSSWRKMKKNAGEAPVVDVWKKEKEMTKRKIQVILLVFYICWSVNVVDGTVLIVAHALYRGNNSPFSQLYQRVFDYKYIYIVWILEAILNPLQGFLNAIAYGSVCRWCCSCVQWLCAHRDDPYISSWSGEYIDVDFRVGRGNIRTNKRRKSN